MTIARRRSPGGWVDSSTVSGADFEHFDANLAEAVDGRGGAYALDVDLEFGGANLILGDSLEVGADLQIGGDTVLTGALDVAGVSFLAGDTTIGFSNANDLEVRAITTFLADVTFSDGVGFQDAAIFEADVLFEQDVDVDGALDAAGNVTVGGVFDANGNWFLGGSSTHGEIAGEIELRGIMTMQGTGKIQNRQQVVATDDNQSITPALVDTLFVPSGVLTTNRNLQIVDTGATDGMRVLLWSEDTANHMTVLRPGGAGIDSFGGASPQLSFIERVLGTWYHRQIGA